jgi:hypothetical protein
VSPSDSGASWGSSYANGDCKLGFAFLVGSGCIGYRCSGNTRSLDSSEDRTRKGNDKNANSRGYRWRFPMFVHRPLLVA